MRFSHVRTLGAPFADAGGRDSTLMRADEAHIDMWGDSRKLCTRLMQKTIKLNLKKHETWVAEVDGDIVACALWVHPGQEWIET